MEEFTVEIFVAIFEEMFGFWLWWLLVATAVTVAVLFFYFLIKEKRYRLKDFSLSMMAAPVGAIVAVLVVFWLTSSNFSDLRGAIDFIIISLVAILSAIATLVSVYVAQSFFAKFNSKYKV